MSRYYSDAALAIETAQAGDPIPPLTKTPTEVDVVRFCAAIRNFHRFHFDQAFMEAKGQGRIIVPGFMLGNWCIEAATRGITGSGGIAGLKFRNTRMAPIGSSYKVLGTVKARDTTAVDCAFEVVDQVEGAVVTTASVRLNNA